MMGLHIHFSMIMIGNLIQVVVFTLHNFLSTKLQLLGGRS